MGKENLKDYLPAITLFALCLVMPRGAFGAGEPWYGPLVYHFTHVNIFHLLTNWLVIARFKPRWINVPCAYLSASAAAYCPLIEVSVPTCGMSAMVFALLARRDAILGIWNWQLLLFNFVFAFFPNFNWKIHLMSYLIAFAFWRLKKLCSKVKKLKSNEG
jgi:membrane associated rhomboid family serine protease